MQPIWLSIVAVAGTLLGSFVTYLFQRQTAQRTSSEARSESRRKEFADAVASFASQATTLRDAEFGRAKKRIDNPRAPRKEEALETYRQRTAAWSAYHTVQLYADPEEDKTLVDEAEKVIKLLRQIVTDTDNEADLRRFDSYATAALRSFVDTANRRLRNFDRPSTLPPSRGQ